jgi:hypothetical protein
MSLYRVNVSTKEKDLPHKPHILLCPNSRKKISARLSRFIKQPSLSKYACDPYSESFAGYGKLMAEMFHISCKRNGIIEAALINSYLKQSESRRRMHNWHPRCATNYPRALNFTLCTP